MSIAETLSRRHIKVEVDNGKRMSSVIAIMCCLHDMTPKFFIMEHFSFDEMCLLLSMLHLRPNVDRKLCLDWEYVTQMIPKDFREVARDSVQAFTMHLSHTAHLQRPEWLYSVPLLHLLHGSAKPFQEIERDPTNITWGDNLLGLGTVRSKTIERHFG